MTCCFDEYCIAFLVSDKEPKINKSKMKKQIELTLDQAKEMFGQNETIDKMLLANFPELNRVTKWEDLKRIEGYCVGTDSKIDSYDCLTLDINKNIFATKEQAEASIALAQLSQLMKHVNGEWEPDWKNPNETKYFIYHRCDDIETDYTSSCREFLSFPTKETRDQFLEDHRELINQAMPLL